MIGFGIIFCPGWHFELGRAIFIMCLRAGEWEWPFRGICVGEASHPGPVTAEEEEWLFGSGAKPASPSEAGSGDAMDVEAILDDVFLMNVPVIRRITVGSTLLHKFLKSWKEHWQVFALHSLKILGRMEKTSSRIAKISGTAML